MTIRKKWKVAIDSQHRIDPGTRLPAHLDRRRRVGASAEKEQAQKPMQLSGFLKSLGKDQKQKHQNNSATLTESDIWILAFHRYNGTDSRMSLPVSLGDPRRPNASDVTG